MHLEYLFQMFSYESKSGYFNRFRLIEQRLQPRFLFAFKPFSSHHNGIGHVAGGKGEDNNNAGNYFESLSLYSTRIAIINCYQLHENNYFHLIIPISLTDVLVGQVIIKTKNIKEGVHIYYIFN